MTVIYVGMIIPFAYAFYMVYNILWGIRQRYKNRKASFDAILSYIAVAPWALMPLLAYLQVTQLTEVLFTNGGFLIITFLFFPEHDRGKPQGSGNTGLDPNQK